MSSSHRTAAPGPAPAVRPRAGQRARALAALWCGLALWWWAPAWAAGQRQVLVLYSLGADSASVWQTLVHRGMVEELAHQSWGDAPGIFEERFDAIRVGEQAAVDSMPPYLRTKYADVHLDAIVTENYLAARFLSAHPELFPGVPRHYVNHGRRDWRPADGDGYEVLSDFERAIGVIAQVAPRTRRIVVVGDQTPRVQEWIAGVRAVVPRFQRIAFEFWDDQNFDQLYAKAAALGPGDAIFMLATYRDKSGAKGVPPEIARKLAQTSPAPVFTHVQSLVLPGIVGGYVISGERIGRVIARLVLGQPADMGSAQDFVFDYPSARRFHLVDAPAGAQWLNRPPDTWETYRWQIIAGLTLIGLEGVLITALVLALRGRRQSMAALHDERTQLEARVVQRTLELMVANTQLEHQATTDPLTGIGNRRKMTEQIGKELERGRRSRRPLALLMIDIDHFKRINDTHGHEVGDRAIVAVARAVTDGMRSVDLVSRFGGEEFVALMPDTDLRVAAVAAERLRADVAALRISGDDGVQIALTISVGVAASGPRGTPDTPSLLLVRADKALYRAKKEGRDRVVVG
ncbi:sensor domain-containing diguanylate cyclase [Rugamonas sp.]|uniref:sensor domain-containing diguanylate cyclase n=1 Tax=Rugamonas sp. TaxID=1926287 RepID=UPI0025E0CF54|nr:sensor domain-containing diguanylate cyclase [Rugamonas sp.]